MNPDDLEVMVDEHVRDLVTGRLPPEDVASNIAEDMRRVAAAARKEMREEAARTLRIRMEDIAGAIAADIVRALPIERD
jgi:hypothetical protein